MKRSLHEGGIRTPMLAYWPGTIGPGLTSNHISAFWDVLPTMAEIISQPVPEQTDGISFLSTLLGKPQKEHDYLYWEYRQGREQEVVAKAIRAENWKAVKKRNKSMELYNLEEDPYEKKNVSVQYPEIMEKMKEIAKGASIPLKQ